eukprot:84927_1
MIIMSFTIIMNDAPHLSVGNYFGAVNDNYTSNHLSGFWKCFTNGIDHQLFDNGYQCSLHNTSLSLNHEIGRGGQGTVYAITIDGSPFVLKHSYAKDVCYHLQREWRVLHMMGSMLHPTLSRLYKSETHCFIILRRINNSITMYDLLEYHSNRLDHVVNRLNNNQSVIAMDRIEWMKHPNELLLFVLRCYASVKRSLDVLSNQFIYYSDELIHNVLLLLDANECVLIDYGLVTQMRDATDIMSPEKHLDHKLKFSPYSAYFLKNFANRKSVMDRFILKGNALKLFRKIAYWNTLHKMAAFAFRVFVSVYVEIMKGKHEYTHRLNQLHFPELDKLKNKLYDLEQARRIEAHRFWSWRARAIELTQIQIKELNENYQMFDDAGTQQFFQILSDIHTQHSMYRTHIELRPYLIK